jgi:opacity protein-like surface antigen
MQKIIITIMMIAISPLAWSQGTFRYGPNERAGEWNLAIEAIYLGSESSSGTNGSGLSIDDDWGFGFMINYNFTNHLALGFDMSFLKPRYEATFATEDAGLQTISHKLSIFNGQLKGTYNILEGPLTPYIDVALGWTSVDSNITDGPPTTGCWWDPWWGWVCRSFYSTYSDSAWTYGGGLGVRWDMTRDMFLRASYNVMVMDLSGVSNIDQFNMGRLEIGWRY